MAPDGDAAGWGVDTGHADPGSIASPQLTAEPGRAGACRPMAAPPRVSQPRGAAEAAPGAAQSGAERSGGCCGRGPPPAPLPAPVPVPGGRNPRRPPPAEPEPAMGALTSRQNAGVEEVDIPANSVYRYPPKSGEPPGCLGSRSRRWGGTEGSESGTHRARPCSGRGDPAHPKTNPDAPAWAP